MVESPREQQPQDLTPREWQVFELIRRGFADHQVAQVLGIAEGEVSRHVSSVLSKLGASREQVSGWRPVTPDETAAPHPSAPRLQISSALKFAAGAAVILIVAAVAAIVLALIIGSDQEATAPNGDEETSGQSDSVIQPLIGEDHWHATYAVVICGEQQPAIPTFDAGVHTHGDGLIHLHPLTPEEEGLGARLVKFFEYAGGELTNDTLRMPGSRTTRVNGGLCPDGRVAFLRVTLNGAPLDDISQYIPQDGDDILISLNP